MLDMDVSASRLPVDACMLVICIMMLVILMYIIVIDRKSRPEHWKDNSLLALAIVAMLVPSVIFLGFYPEPDISGQGHLAAVITITGSSQDIEMEDMWISVDDAGASIYQWDNTTSVSGLSRGQFYEITLACNGTSVFDGLNSVALNFYHEWDRTMVYYANASGNLSIAMEDSDYSNTIRLAFSYGDAWAEFEIWAAEPEVEC
jgi:hypothetical protein